MQIIVQVNFKKIVSFDSYSQHHDFDEHSGRASFLPCLLLSIRQSEVAKTHPLLLGDNNKNYSCQPLFCFLGLCSLFCVLGLHARKFSFTNLLQPCSRSLTFASVTELSVESSPQPFGLSLRYPNPNL